MSKIFCWYEIVSPSLKRRPLPNFKIWYCKPLCVDFTPGFVLFFCKCSTRFECSCQHYWSLSFVIAHVIPLSFELTYTSIWPFRTQAKRRRGQTLCWPPNTCLDRETKRKKKKERRAGAGKNTMACFPSRWITMWTQRALAQARKSELNKNMKAKKKARRFDFLSSWWT